MLLRKVVFLLLLDFQHLQPVFPFLAELRVTLAGLAAGAGVAGVGGVATFLFLRCGSWGVKEWV